MLKVVAKVRALKVAPNKFSYPDCPCLHCLLNDQMKCSPVRTSLVAPAIRHQLDHCPYTIPGTH